eukprot:CAMPEP_0181488614 /NCGR_PEP_ID=MMETSP1110-20121109/48496_1 /TAXON_ID=174948 /ORGANISM="Symbiodinium sp., Strain CCMP421" /LENGTH=96 /DNA_ID=CAMNT_0023615299 /DNA_START=755 /DNA_END=1045 /DNA_ORIENTATION=+
MLQRKHRNSRLLPAARTRQATCHATLGGGGGLCTGFSTSKVQRMTGTNQKRWSSTEHAPQKPTASGHGAGQVSSIHERKGRTFVFAPVPSSPQRST